MFRFDGSVRRAQAECRRLPRRIAAHAQSRLAGVHAVFLSPRARPPTRSPVVNQTFTASRHHRGGHRGSLDHVQMASGEGGKKSQIARTPHSGLAQHLPVDCSPSRARPPIRAADAAAGNRFLLGRPSAARRSVGAGACRAQRSTRRLDLAAWAEPQGRIAHEFPNAAGALPGTRLRERSGILLRVRTTGLSVRLACGSLGCRPQ